MRRLIYLIVITVVLLCSCRRDPVWQTLDIAEDLMEEYPDSALTILNDVDGKKLSGETQARYALLLSQAYDKNYIDLTNDSLISIAVEFYSRSDDRRHRMLAYHYLATIYRNAERYGIALRTALKAHDEAVALDDKPNISRTSSLIGRIYVMAINYKEALRWDLQALHYAKLVNNPVWIQNGYENVAEELTAMSRGHEALQYADSAIAISGTPSPDVLQTQYLTYNALKMTHEQDSILSVIHALGYTPSHYITDVLDHFKDRDAHELIAYQNDVIEDQNRYILEMTNSTMDEFVSMYNQEKSDQLIADIKSSKALNIAISIMALFIISTLCLMLWGLRLKANKQRIQNENAVQILSLEYESIYNELLKHEQNANTSTVSSLQTQIQAGKIAAQELFLCKYSWIEKLGNIYLDAEASKNTTADRAIRDIKKNLDTVKTKQFIPSLVKVINQYRNNLLERVEAECPSILKSELDILALLCANLSPRIISFILSIKPQSIYNAKSTIKRKIIAENPSLLSEMSDVFGG